MRSKDKIQIINLALRSKSIFPNTFVQNAHKKQGKNIFSLSTLSNEYRICPTILSFGLSVQEQKHWY